MSKDQLNRSGADQTLRGQKESPSPIQTNTAQQLRSGQGEENAYQSEEHRQTYHNHSQSYNDQRDAYTEQAMNAPVSPSGDYDYQGASGPGQQSASESYKRYVTGGSTDSIFSASDFDLANATENYLQKNSDFFSGQMSELDRQIDKTTGRIGKLETNSLQYRNSYKPWKHRLVIDRNREKARSWHARGLLHKDVIHKETNKGIGRLKFRSEKIALTEGKHRQKAGSAERRWDRRGFYLRRLNDSFKNNLQGDNFSEDEILAEMKRKAKTAARGARWKAKRNYRNLKHTIDGYSRLKFQKARLASLNARKAHTYSSVPGGS